MFKSVTEKSKQESVECELRHVHLDDTTIFSSNGEDSRLLVMNAYCAVTNPVLSVSIQAQSIYHFGRKVLSACRDLHDRMNRQKAMEGAEPLFFDEFFNFIRETKSMRRSQSLTVVQPYLYIISILGYDANDRKRLGRRKNGGQTERTLKKPDTFFFSGPKTP